MNIRRSTIIILAIVAFLVVMPLVLLPYTDFEGADMLAEDSITEINPDYEPWFESFWEPPSGEIESLLFALQAALGGGFLGYYIGLKRGKHKAGEE